MTKDLHTPLQDIYKKWETLSWEFSSADINHRAGAGLPWLLIDLRYVLHDLDTHYKLQYDKRLKNSRSSLRSIVRMIERDLTLEQIIEYIEILREQPPGIRKVTDTFKHGGLPIPWVSTKAGNWH